MSTSPIETVIKQALKTFNLCNKDAVKNFNENFTKLLGLVGNISSEDIHFEQYLLTQQVREIKRFRSDRYSSNVKIDVQYVNRAPVTYIQIFENEVVTLGVFVIREGNKLPLHNHPLMHGIIRVLAGTLKMTSYSVLDIDQPADQGGGEKPSCGDTPAGDRPEEIHHFNVPGVGLVPIPCYVEGTEPLESQDSGYHSQSSQQCCPPRSVATEYCPHNILSYLESPNAFPATRHPPLIFSSSDGAKYLSPRQRNIHEIHCVNGPAAFLDVIAPPYKPVTLQDCTYFEDIGNLAGDSKSTRLLHRIACPPYFFTDEERYKGPPLQAE